MPPIVPTRGRGARQPNGSSGTMQSDRLRSRRAGTRPTRPSRHATVLQHAAIGRAGRQRWPPPVHGKCRRVRLPACPCDRIAAYKGRPTNGPGRWMNGNRRLLPDRNSKWDVVEDLAADARPLPRSHPLVPVRQLPLQADRALTVYRTVARLGSPGDRADVARTNHWA